MIIFKYNSSDIINISLDAYMEARHFAFRSGAVYKSNSAPLLYQEGKSKPYWIGSSYKFETRGGKPIRYPSAYSKVGWSNMVYIPSSRSIIVGKDWLKVLEIDLLQVKFSRQRKRFVHRDIAKFAFHF